jgi:hypothetical protein
VGWCRRGRRYWIGGPLRLLLLILHTGLLQPIVLRVRRARGLLLLVAVDIRRVTGRWHQVGLVSLLPSHMLLALIHARVLHLRLVGLAESVV